MSVGPFIGEKAIGDITGVAHQIVEEFIKLPQNTNKTHTGGYLTIISKTSGQLLLLTKIGTIHEMKDHQHGTKADKYYALSMEKARRLFQTHKMYNYASSWQSRDENDNLYGGAIVAGNVIVSFSGLPELGDEAVALVMACAMEWLKPDDALIIAERSNNHFFHPLYHEHFPSS